MIDGGASSSTTGTVGFKAGGDDYITKPFDMEELLARIAAHLRREERRGGKIKGRFQEDLFIDYGGQRVTVKGNDIELAEVVQSW